ncbi:hypothetical protein EDB89DRAFT_1913563 [Lactarius sanguifluus]|nr:hypothetical protein EDB89DRAFT_1913563 [Lactarius sanguifluus]
MTTTDCQTQTMATIPTPGPTATTLTPTTWTWTGLNNNNDQDQDHSNIDNNTSPHINKIDNHDDGRNNIVSTTMAHRQPQCRRIDKPLRQSATTLRQQPPWHIDSRNNNMPTTATHQQPQRQHIDNNYDDHSNQQHLTTTTTTTSTGINTRNSVLGQLQPTQDEPV